MNVSKKYKNLFIVLITIITVNLLFKTRDFSELMGDLVIFTLAYLVLFPLLETLIVSMAKSKKKTRN